MKELPSGFELSNDPILKCTYPHKKHDSPHQVEVSIFPQIWA